MNKKSTQVGKVVSILALLTLLFSSSARTQTVPKLKFRQPHLIAGTNGQVGATYRFLNVSPNINANIKIENIVNGAILRNIDDSTLGYYDAWQPTVGGPGTYGSSYIKWAITFDSAGAPYVYTKLNASAIDVDGDGVKVREFVNVNGQSSYNIPTQVPSMLTITNQKDTDNIMGNDASDSNLHALGPVVNRVGIDTSSQDVRVNFTFVHSSGFKIYTGSQVDNNGATGAIATDRYHCIYFMDISGTLNVLPVNLQSFLAIPAKNKVNLSWTTSGTLSGNHFEVERSFDQNNFSTAALVLGPESTHDNLDEYSFTDNSMDLTGHSILYYRLKLVDMNGRFSYSCIKMVRISSAETVSNATMQVVPNPYMDKININFESLESGNAEIRIINATGNIVKRATSCVYPGNNLVQLQDLYSQSPGIYFVNLVVNGQSVSSSKIIKL